MSTDRDTTRIVRSWLEEGVSRLPDRVLDAVIDQLPATPQRRRTWSAWRANQMNVYAKLLGAAAAVLVVAVVGYQFVPGKDSPGSSQPAVSPSPTPTLLARGSFTLYGARVELDAAGSGDSVTGTMAVTHDQGNFTVDLKCAQTIAGGVLLLVGDITQSASPHAKQGFRELLVLRPGTPVYASFDSEDRPGGDVRRATSCRALLDQVIATGTQTVAGDNGLAPIEGGTVEFGP